MNARSPADAPANATTPVPSSDEANRHALHHGKLVWIETNCYVDLWIELLHHFGCDPHAALNFTVTQAFEGDQFTFPKFSLDDISRLYGLQTQELAIYDSLEGHVVEQTKRGQVVVVEVDSFYLPDTRVPHIGRCIRRRRSRSLRSIRRQSTLRTSTTPASSSCRAKTTTASSVVCCPISRATCRRSFLMWNSSSARPPLEGEALTQRSVDLLRLRLIDRPAANPISQWRAEFPEHLRALLEHDISYYHLYTFNVIRQLGFNFELLSKYLAWLDERGVAVPIGDRDQRAKNRQRSDW